jgi:hypothetical protein
MNKLRATPAMVRAAAKAPVSAPMPQRVAPPAGSRTAAKSAPRRPSPPPPAAPAKPNATQPPPLSAEAKAEAKIAARTARNGEIYALLSTVFPEVFRRPPVPLAIGIHKPLTELVAGEIETFDLRCFLAYWTRQPAYLSAIAQGEPRRNLDGSAADMPTATQQKDAALRVFAARAEAVLARIAARRAVQPNEEAVSVENHA